MSNPPSAEEIAWMKAHIDESRVPNVIAATSISAALAVIAVVLRLWSRLRTTRYLVTSDVLILLCLFFYIGFCTVFGLSTKYGAGKMVILITDPYDIKMLSILNICNVILYGVSTGFVKGSILALYYTIFPQRSFRIYVWVLATINILGTLVIIPVATVQCVPVEALWRKDIEGQCIVFSAFSIFNTIYNFVLDILILTAPLSLVTKLNLTRRKKILVALNFALGGGACIVAIIRTPFSRKVWGTSNPSWDIIPGGLLCTAEVVVAIWCASLPVYRPLFRRFTPGLVTQGSHSNSRRGYDMNSRGTYGQHSEVNTHISSSGQRGVHRSGIAITDDITMMTHANVNGKWVRLANDDEAEAGLVDKTPNDS